MDLKVKTVWDVQFTPREINLNKEGYATVNIVEWAFDVHELIPLQGIQRTHEVQKAKGI